MLFLQEQTPSLNKTLAFGFCDVTALSHTSHKEELRALEFEYRFFYMHTLLLLLLLLLLFTSVQDIYNIYNQCIPETKVSTVRSFAAALSL
jgi:hypothetical protein